jgi:molybdopterin adenylyltransferase
MQLHDVASLIQHFSADNPMRIEIITMSDRAHAGEYEDAGGPAVQKALDDVYGAIGLAYRISTRILPDDATVLESVLTESRDAGVHVVFTTGGTGVGPRDITPDVVLKLADKVIPGIMELIRVKYGKNKPLAALSRTVAALMGTTLVFALPGSPRGVSEYMVEILKTLDHLLCVVHGIDSH